MVGQIKGVIFMKLGNMKGFTLIELLIVVAIIAILAAIAVPNFLEAQVRAKVSREKNNMRALATALESYKVDTNKYPMDAWWWAFYALNPGGYDNVVPLSLLTTPIAYMSSIPECVFFNKRADQRSNPMNDVMQRQYRWGSEQSSIPTLMQAVDVSLFGYDIPADRYPKNQWFLGSIGPDMLLSAGEYVIYGEDILHQMKPYMVGGQKVTDYGALYDATNGTISNGDIMRVGP